MLTYLLAIAFKTTTMLCNAKARQSIESKKNLKSESKLFEKKVKTDKNFTGL